MKTVLTIIGYLELIFLGLMSGPANLIGQVPPISTNDWRDGYTLILLDSTNAQATSKAREYITSQGGRIAIAVPPHVLLGWIPSALEPKLISTMGINSIHRGVVEVAAAPFQDADTLAAIGFFNHVASGESKAEELKTASGGPVARPLPLINCVQSRPPANPQEVEENLRKFGLYPGPPPGSGTSDYMTGVVAVALFFMESDGTVDANKYTWSSTDEQDTYNRALNGLSWWPGQAATYGETLSFTVIRYSANSSVCQQGYEPILHPSSDDTLWISAIMGNLGYTSGNYLSRVTAFDTSLRSSYATDWAYSVFIGYNPSGAPSKFTDGFFAYNPGLGGPLVQMLFNNDGWGATNFGLILTHETGHIFWACDEYYQAGYGGCQSCGNCVVAPGRSIDNGNCEYCNPNAVVCMMRGNTYALCPYTPLQIGWLTGTWVDFNYVGTELGTFSQPYATFMNGVNAVAPGSRIFLKAGQSHEPQHFPLTVTKAMTIKAFGGSANVGH